MARLRKAPGRVAFIRIRQPAAAPPIATLHFLHSVALPRDALTQRHTQKAAPAAKKGLTPYAERIIFACAETKILR